MTVKEIGLASATGQAFFTQVLPRPGKESLMSAVDQEKEFEALVGKYVRIEKFGSMYDGILKGRSDVIVISPDGKTPKALWVLEHSSSNFESKELHFYPNDGWEFRYLVE